MGLSTLLKTFTASLLLSTSVLAAQHASNSSQQVVANTLADESIDMSKVQKYKSLLDQSAPKPIHTNIVAADTVGEPFDSAFKWSDVLDSAIPLTANAFCPERCLTCASGCDPVCCIVSETSSRPNGAGGTEAQETASPVDSPTPENQESKQTGARPPGPILPDPLACPCNCEPSCPPSVQAICCYTGGANSARDPSQPSPPEDDHGRGQHDPNQNQKPIVNNVDKLSLREDFPSRPNLPAACPCGCEPSCPAYIQAICCTTVAAETVANNSNSSNSSSSSTSTSASTSSGGGDDSKLRVDKADVTGASQSEYDVLALVAQSAAGDPVSVLAGVNLTIFDSFVTLDLVKGLERASEIAFNADLKTFEIVLTLVVGPHGREQSLRQSFRVIDGSRLWEREQIMLGLGALARIRAVHVNKDFLTDLESGLPVLTGTKASVST
ncbi:hypothetical protein A1O3_02330 [Capronia epimyces CBS 606.96]|uniref:Hydrophobin n=1 Tax=Capronia epimyces CBS 606.96 TaxID=1182542 RepID=W9Z418_9EURO|nr:uncharacterized protein A1O3_02330 [Capronia epimyces CBS 606.96]EXJ89264.1 hypothetical protein A1O3_02330 [Capronia epimyces CBS 606.96]